jgi:hypothetical protein
MRKLLVSIFSMALLYSCSNQSTAEPETETTAIADKTTLEREHLNGKVKSITETSYTPNDSGEIGAMDSCCTEIGEFDSAGFIVKKSDMHVNGSLIKQNVWKHKEGKVESITVTEEGKVVWKRVMHFNDAGNLEYVTDSDTTGNVSEIFTIENEPNETPFGKGYTADSTYTGKWAWKVTDDMQTGMSWTDSTGTLIYDRTGELNDKGFMAKSTSITVVNDSTTVTKVETYAYTSYDEMGNWTERIKSEDGIVVKIQKRTYAYMD